MSEHPTTGDYIHDLMVIMGEADSDLEGLIPKYRNGKLRILIGCSDLFYWATADGEVWLPEDVPLMWQCLDDLKAADKTYGTCYLLELFCCRKRQMRPQHPYFRNYDREKCGYFEDRLSPAVRALFDALGPDGSDRDRG